MEMDKERKQVFRQKSLDRVSSPEDLNSYLNVMNVGVWVILAAVIIFLIGAAVWCTVFRLETDTVTVAAVVKNGEASLFITDADKALDPEGKLLKINGETYVLPAADFNAVKLFAQNDKAVASILGLSEEQLGDYARVMKIALDLPNGVYEAEIVAEDVSPMSLILN